MLYLFFEVCFPNAASSIFRCQVSSLRALRSSVRFAQPVGMFLVS